ncbi:MAG TPA: aspartate-semialdehyde dehydrogenase [Methanoregulaceae archaeon]|nr:aspartate-semialdehyde dehydrogenase [Methanolinea sp.]HOP67415.1 aspartate-semialdehyde dehydrogenase [Methanoregulaceae archaeon]HPJ74602.1 aspartate-semialdehyde dehydrogenase [Methanoregulaceae archaeon]HPQ76692.1 aspartate-semialdehyde dehydrogenase [Methanoregulaceae archaeon]HRX33793.1 aspartate-semialdehyde dehydrogenase [Methanoregulaceae archaeon]
MINVGVLGATGAVGQRFVQLLAEHPLFHLKTLTASDRSAGRLYRDVVNWRLDVPFPKNAGNITVSRTDVDSLKDVDLVFSALPAEIAGKIETECAEAGIGVCSNAATHRMEPDIPLVIPELNPDHLGLIDVQRDRGRDGFIVTNPNCSTIVMCMSFAPIRQFSFTDVRVATLQAISGAGFAGIPAMTIFDNVVPYIGSEEEKMERETQKIMGSLDGNSIRPAPFSVSACCHRVPVIDGHTMSLWLDIKEPVETIREAFMNYSPPIRDLPSQPPFSVQFMTEQDRPQPRLDRMRGNGMTVSVGRLREGIRYVAMGHNTIRGAAGASVLNAELIHSRKYL